MSTRLTIFTAVLVQDSDLSVSGLDRDSSADHPFTIVDGNPVLVGKGIKGAAVAMARRFFAPLPRSISEDSTRRTALQTSCWEFSNARLNPTRNPPPVVPRLRASVGILQETGARAEHVLHDREVVPAGSKWDLNLRVDWQLAGTEAEETEGILGYILEKHWKAGRCWLGGAVARGLGWCHLVDLKAYRLNDTQYDTWVTSGRGTLPHPANRIPEVEPTRGWCFRTREITIGFGEYKPNGSGEYWGVDMLAIGPHYTERATQAAGSATWAQPSWVAQNIAAPTELATDRSLLMHAGVPVLPGASVRGPMRHAFSARVRAQGHAVVDPHEVQGNVGDADPAGQIFGTVKKSSRVLIRDACATGSWTAARLHMHAEDEFSAGSYGSAKRDAVRVLSGAFPVRIVVDGPDAATVDPIVSEIDRLVTVGSLGHLPVGGHKTRGAGFGHWTAGTWDKVDVAVDPARPKRWSPAPEAPAAPQSANRPRARSAYAEWRDGHSTSACVEATPGSLNGTEKLTLGEAAGIARKILNGQLAAWWCEPSIDFDRTKAVPTFGRNWPAEADANIQLDEVAFFAPHAVWRAARTVNGWRTVVIKEGKVGTQAVVLRTPARLHGDTTRFSAASKEKGHLVVREWYVEGQVIGYTLEDGRNV